MARDCEYFPTIDDDELSRLKARIAELEKENESLKYSVAALETDLAMSQRWRNVEEELPHKGQKVLFRAKYKTDKVREWIGDFRHVDDIKVDFAVFYASAPGWGCEFLQNEIFGWMPLPAAPKEKA